MDYGHWRRLQSERHGCIIRRHRAFTERSLDRRMRAIHVFQGPKYAVLLGYRLWRWLVRLGSVLGMKHVRSKIRLVFALFTLMGGVVIAACGGSGSPASNVATCGPPPPSAAPPLVLVYPIPGAVGVPIALGEAIFLGPYSLDTVAITSSSGAAVSTGGFMVAPSPLPSPNAAPSNYNPASGPFIAVPVPTLSPATTYSVTYSYQGYADSPPSCTSTVTLPLGSFTTTN